MQRLAGTELLDALEAGEARVAEPDGAGGWRVHGWVQEELLALFKTSPVIEFGEAATRALWPFVDKADLAPRVLRLRDRVRLVPGGSTVRRGAFLGADVVVMPPSYVNVAAHVGSGSMIDSHVLVGSGAQVGERVHLAAGTQLGGVLEPAGARPVVIEDDAWIGAQCGLFEGVLVRRRAVLGAGVILTASTPVFDLVHERTLASSPSAPLEVPAGAVVVPGTRAARGDWAAERGLGLRCALIVKYRDDSTDRAVGLTEALRWADGSDEPPA